VSEKKKDKSGSKERRPRPKKVANGKSTRASKEWIKENLALVNGEVHPARPSRYKVVDTKKKSCVILDTTSNGLIKASRADIQSVLGEHQAPAYVAIAYGSTRVEVEVSARGDLSILGTDSRSDIEVITDMLSGLGIIK